MVRKSDAKVTITGECGHEFEVSIAGQESDGMDYRCPVCGRAGHFDAEDAVAIQQHFEALTKAARAAFRDVTKGMPKA